MCLSLDLSYPTVFALEIQMVPNLLIIQKGVKIGIFPQAMECCRTCWHGTFDSGSKMLLFLLDPHIMFYHSSLSRVERAAWGRDQLLGGVGMLSTTPIHSWSYYKNILKCHRPFALKCLGWLRFGKHRNRVNLF